MFTLDPHGFPIPIPNDGQLFTSFDANQNVNGRWIWRVRIDPTTGQVSQGWEDINNLPPMKVMVGVNSVPFTMDIESLMEQLAKFGGPKCNCGSDKCGHPGHSTWCDKYDSLNDPR